MADLIPMLAPWGGRALAAVMLLVGGWVAWRALRGDRAKPPRCPTCGYDATGLPSNVCPECGHAVRREADRRRTRRHWRAAVVGVLVACAVPAWAVQRRVSAYGWDYYTYVGPIRWVSPTRAAQAFDVGDFRVEVRRDRIPWDPADPVLRVSGPGGADFTRAGWRMWIRAGGAGGPLLLDLNGNGFPEVLAETDPGGIHPNTSGLVVELNPQTGPRLLAEIDANAGGGVTLRDVDADGTPEVLTRDWRFCYGKSTAADPEESPEVVLAWRDGALRPAVELMRRPLPTAAESAALARGIRAELEQWAEALDARRRLRAAMLRLTYAGHPRAADDLLDAAWPPGREGKRAFADEFRADLAASPYAARLIAAADGS